MKEALCDGNVGDAAQLALCFNAHAAAVQNAAGGGADAAGGGTGLGRPLPMAGKPSQPVLLPA